MRKRNCTARIVKGQKQDEAVAPALLMSLGCTRRHPSPPGSLRFGPGSLRFGPESLGGELALHRGSREARTRCCDVCLGAGSATGTGSWSCSALPEIQISPATAEPLCTPLRLERQNSSF